MGLMQDPETETSRVPVRAFEGGLGKFGICTD
jgi:hypothetical protein